MNFYKRAFVLSIPAFVGMAAVLFLTLHITGCGGSGSRDNSRILSGTISGKLSPGIEGIVLIQDSDGEVTEAPLDLEGRYAVSVKPGVYNVMLKSAATLQLIARAVSVEDNMTISLLDASLVPMPQVVSVKIVFVEENSAVIEWITDIESDGRIDYGVDTRYGFSSYTDTALKTKHRTQLYDLRPDVTYHFRIVAGRHALENTETFSKDYTFTTAPVTQQERDF